MSGAAGALPQLTNEGPLTWMARAIQARLQQGFPPERFDMGWLPAKPSRAWFDRAVRRSTYVALGWNGIRPTDGGSVFAGVAHWTVLLITKNVREEERYLGDQLAPGLFAMQRVAAVLLNGFLVDPDGTPWTASGTVQVTAVDNLFTEDWAPENAAIAGLSLTIGFEELLPDGLEEALSALPAELQIQWQFGEAEPPLTDTLELTPAGAPT